MSSILHRVLIPFWFLESSFCGWAAFLRSQSWCVLYGWGIHEERFHQLPKCHSWRFQWLWRNLCYLLVDWVRYKALWGFQALGFCCVSYKTHVNWASLKYLLNRIECYVLFLSFLGLWASICLKVHWVSLPQMPIFCLYQSCACWSVRAG